MDEDIMTRSIYGKVIFNAVEWTSNHLVLNFYPKYIYEELKTSVLSSVGLYRVPNNNPEDYIIKQEIFIVLKSLGEDILLEFERSKLPYDDRSFYIFQFLNEKGEIMGASTPFKIRVPPSPTGSNESDEFVVIDQDLIKSNEDPESITEPQSLSKSSFVVLSEECKPKESILLDSIHSMADSLNTVQLSEDNDKSSETPSMTSHESLPEEDEKKIDDRDETIQLLSEERSKLKELLQSANDTIETSQNEISKLSEELQVKDKKIEELEKAIQQSEERQRQKDQTIKELQTLHKEHQRQKDKTIKDLQALHDKHQLKIEELETEIKKIRNNQRPRSSDSLTDFQTLHKKDQLKIYELETEIKRMEKEMKHISSSTNSKFEDISKSIHELQNSAIGGRSTTSSIDGTSFDNLDSYVIENALNEAQVNESEEVIKSEDENKSISLKAETPSIPRILDDGKVVIGNSCPICGQEFDENDEESLMIHVNNHLPSDTLECPMCQEKFDLGKEDELEAHVQVHFDFELDDDDVAEEENREEPQRSEPFSGVRNVFQFLNSLNKFK